MRSVRAQGVASRVQRPLVWARVPHLPHQGEGRHEVTCGPLLVVPSAVSACCPPRSDRQTAGPPPTGLWLNYFPVSPSLHLSLSSAPVLSLLGSLSLSQTSAARSQEHESQAPDQLKEQRPHETGTQAMISSPVGLSPGVCIPLRGFLWRKIRWGVERQTSGPQRVKLMRSNRRLLPRERSSIRLKGDG